MSDGLTSTVGVLGAGASGVLVGMELRRAGVDDVVLYEKLPDVGGTWYRNTYPGLHCDIPSHLYCYSTEPNPDWSMVFSPQEEIQRYIRSCADKYDLIERTRFSTCVDAARFDAQSGIWTLEMADGSQATHRVLVAATGGLTEPHVPRLEGLERFAGETWHSGAWRHDVDLTGLRVAVVGSAASAVQVVPQVAASAAEVHVFSRTPNWVTPRNNRHYTDADKEDLRSDVSWRRLRREQYRAYMWWYRAFRRDPVAIERLRTTSLDHMGAAIDDPELIAALTPTFDPGCKRILVSDDYYPALAEDHVRLIPHGVTGFTETSVLAADGSETSVDVVVFCTGYKLGGREDGGPALEVHGPHGRTLRQALAERPEAYKGVLVPGFPNYFTVVGVNGAVAHAPIFLSAEIDAEFIVGWVRRIIDEDLRSVDARGDVTRTYNERIQEELQTMSWAGDCPSFYKDRSGRIVSFFPGSVGHMRRELRASADSDFDVVA